MSIKALGGNRFKVVVRLGEKGKREATVVGREAAEEEELRLKKELRWELYHELPTGSLTTLGDVLELYNKTRTWGESYYNRLYHDLKTVPLEKSWAALETMVEGLRVETNKRGKKYEPASINRHIAMIQAAVSKAYETKVGPDRRPMIRCNYLESFPHEEENNLEYIVLSSEQKLKFWNALDVRLRPLYYFACRIPARMSELLNIQRNHCNRFSGFITLPDGSTKNGFGRQLRIWPEFQPYVNEFLNSPATHLFNRGPDEDYLPLGYELDGEIAFTLRKPWYAACEAIQMPEYNFHKTRQEAILSLLSEGWTLDEVRILGGWKSHAAFRRYYQDEVVLMVKNGTYPVSTDWHTTFAADLVRKAA